jgi:hypothetical protein
MKMCQLSCFGLRPWQHSHQAKVSSISSLIRLTIKQRPTRSNQWAERGRKAAVSFMQLIPPLALSSLLQRSSHGASCIMASWSGSHLDPSP